MRIRTISSIFFMQDLVDVSPSTSSIGSRSSLHSMYSSTMSTRSTANKMKYIVQEEEIGGLKTKGYGTVYERFFEPILKTSCIFSLLLKILFNAVYCTSELIYSLKIPITIVEL